MAIHPYTATEEQVQSKLAKGFGRGCGSTYRPLLNHLDVRQRRGDLRRFKCTLSRRVVVLFSPLARSARLGLEYSGKYVAIDEYVPLDPQLVRSAATKLGITPPRNDQGEQRLLMATFRVTSIASPSKQEAVIVCSTSQLNDFNTIVELELQRVAWSDLGISLKVITDSDQCLPAALRNNLDALFPHRFSPDQEPSPGYLQRLEEQVSVAMLRPDARGTLQAFVSELEMRLSVPAGECINAALRLIWRRQLNANLRGSLLHEQLVSDIAKRSRA